MMRKIIIIISVIAAFSAMLFAAGNRIAVPYSSAGDPNLYIVFCAGNDSNDVWDFALNTWSSWAESNEPNYTAYMYLAHKNKWFYPFPSAINARGEYDYTIYLMAGTEPNISSDLILFYGYTPWSGTEEVTLLDVAEQVNELWLDSGGGSFGGP